MGGAGWHREGQGVGGADVLWDQVLWPTCFRFRWVQMSCKLVSRGRMRAACRSGRSEAAAPTHLPTAAGWAVGKRACPLWEVVVPTCESMVLLP